MKNFILIYILLIFFTLSCLGQKRDSIPEISLSIISQVNQGNSFVTFPTDIGNIEPLWFEGNLIPNFYIRQSKNSKLMGVLTPQIIIRMYQEKSYPIQTPSYMPQITIYYSFSGESNSKKNITLYGRIAHHSNGQSGDFFLENGELNLKSGDFSTNYVEAGIIKTNICKWFYAYQFFKTSIEIHPESWSGDEFDGIYSKYRWHTSFSIFKLPSQSIHNYEKKAEISVKGEATWMFGELNNLNDASLKRLNLSLTLFYHPKFLEDLGLFVQYYHGSDYYNMYFDHMLDVVRFGLMTEKLRF